MHASGGAGNIIPHVGQVALRCRLQISERSTEGHDLSPESKKSTMLSTEVLIEGLKIRKKEFYNAIYIFFASVHVPLILES